MKNLFLLTMIFTQSVFANVVYWGSDSSCDYNSSNYTLQEVIDLGEEQIRITNQQIINEDLVISNQQINIAGGYDDCSEFEVGTKTTIQGTGNTSVIRIIPTDNDLPNSVLLSGLVIKGGQYSPFNSGGGITLHIYDSQSVLLTVRDSLITQNFGSRGGGIYTSGTNAILTLDNTLVFSNEAYGQAGGSGLGGGLYCQSGRVSITDDSGVSFNRATGTVQNSGHGGGIYATTGCYVSVMAASDGGLFDYRGIAYNTAIGNGGGVFLNQSKLQLSSYMLGKPVNVNDNGADANNDGYGDGGGIYVQGSSAQAELDGATIQNNVASNGAGIKVTNGGLLTADNNAGYCWDFYACNQIIENKTSGSVGSGGGLYMINGMAYLSHTHLAYNQANTGVAINTSSQSSLVLERSLVYRNGEEHGTQWDSQHTVRMEDSFLQVNQITTAVNDTTGATFSLLDSDRVINNSIVHEPLTNQVGNFIGGSGSQNCNLMDNNFGWQGGSNTFLANPGFVSLDNNDFHITSESVAVDQCDNGEAGTPSAGPLYDIDLELAPINSTVVANGTGIYDIGVDEYHNPDVIFTHGFD